VLIAGLELVRKGPAGVRPELIQWLEGFQARRTAAARKSPTPTRATIALAYVIGPSYRGPAVTLYKAKLKPDGTIRILDEPWNNIEAALARPMKFLSDEDLTLLRRLWFSRGREDYGGLVFRGTAGDEILQQLVATGRAYAKTTTDTPHPPRELHPGRPHAGTLEWQPLACGYLRCVLTTDPPSTMLIPTDPFWYVDVRAGEAGEVECPWPTAHLADLLSMPALSPEDALLVAAVLRDTVSQVPPRLPTTPRRCGSSTQSRYRSCTRTRCRPTAPGGGRKRSECWISRR
jgi:hypothetical protein